MNDNCLAAVRINQDLCSRCTVCFSLCPFEAIDRLPDGGKLSIDIQKCQVCGICYSACPVSAIEMSYYDYGGPARLRRIGTKEPMRGYAGYDVQGQLAQQRRGRGHPCRTGA